MAMPPLNKKAEKIQINDPFTNVIKYWPVTVSWSIFFLWRFSFTDTYDLQDCRGRRGLSLFLSTTSIHSRTFWHLLATLHSGCITCNYQSAARWDLPPWGNFIDNGMLISVCLDVEVILDFLLHQFHIGKELI